MSEPPERKRLRVTPRASNANEEAPDEETEETAFATLHQLGRIIRPASTPVRRPSSAGPLSGGRERNRTPNIAIRTPGSAARTPRGGPATRPITARRGAPTTPHAIRALRERLEAARTPGQNRRKSGRGQRETPRDTLRALSRILAKTTKPTVLSPDGGAPPPRNRNPALDDFDASPDMERPRLSMPLGDLYDDDSFHEAPPRQSMLPDLPDDVDNTTLQSLEFGRRALSEDPRRRFSTRLSGFGELNELGAEPSEFEIDGAFINQRPRMDEDALLLGDDDVGDDDNTVELRALMDRRQSRLSELEGLEDDDDEPDDPTFRFTIPQRVLREASPAVAGAEAPDDDAGQTEDGEYEEDDDDMVPPVQDDDDEAVEAEEDIALDDEPEFEDPDEEMMEADLRAYREEEAAVDRSILPGPDPATAKKAGRRQRKLRVSKDGTEYPEFPSGVVKKLANGFAKSQGINSKISKETLTAIMQATDWFFEQAGEDLADYAQHAKRKTIDDSDVITLMKRYVTLLYIYTPNANKLSTDNDRSMPTRRLSR
ncbi:uncharacterized protein BDZ99DRAFT_118649 [Mytilinidion resinicola]|uniref:CENP-T/Histone H4 histone fold domain-containing protein n=1 Tax=Mytilinidion resinicola TaxID=574789 RepID=A0A6A6Y998_9PEZI|nr:uncharacterized protein BDZ99DRAFT_118649 [Mytilinidion resinicola]KAF2805392.1 hypothetical protein BDZ99DRAFT_118649 [Mytilinidion resinicola]